MIEREFIRNKVKNLNIKERITKIIPKNAGIGKIIVERTPISETVTIDAIRPGLIIGRRGETIKKLTDEIKKRYKLDNPQIKVREIAKPNLNASAVARRIASDFERFGSQRFKAIGHRSVSNIMREGALGTEIILSGKLPSKRARVWRFSEGYMKKCGRVSDIEVDKAIESAILPSGVVGIKVNILRADVRLPDKITIVEPKEIVEEKVKIEVKPAEKTTAKSKISPILESKASQDETKEKVAKAIEKSLLDKSEQVPRASSEAEGKATPKKDTKKKPKKITKKATKRTTTKKKITKKKGAKKK